MSELLVSLPRGGGSFTRAWASAWVSISGFRAAEWRLGLALIAFQPLISETTKTTKVAAAAIFIRPGSGLGSAGGPSDCRSARRPRRSKLRRPQLWPPLEPGHEGRGLESCGCRNFGRSLGGQAPLQICGGRKFGAPVGRAMKR